MNTRKKFRKELASFKRAWLAGLVAETCMRAAGWWIAALITYAFLDFFMAFPYQARLALNILLLAVPGGAFLVLLFRALKLNKKDAARRADKILGGNRRSILSALELDNWLSRQTDMETMEAFLAGRSISGAGAKLGQIGFRKRFPFDLIRARLKITAAQLCAFALVLLLFRDASAVIAARIFTPHRDIPPFSKYVFTVFPELPDVIYGEDAEITVEISGAPVKQQVWFISRYGGKQHKTACFQETGQRFAQRIEKVVNPVEFCFSTGKARSKWHKINLLLQPRIAVASVTITPPDYSGLPTRRFFAGNEDIAGLKNSKVTLSLTSNRPLLDGLAVIKEGIGLDNDEESKGIKTGSHTVSFEWEIEHNATVEVTVRDMQGTRNADPLRLRQRLIPDAPPDVAISQPGGFALATPSGVIAISGYASDDIALRRVDLVRTVAGFRDRLKTVGPNLPGRSFSFEKRINLDSIGVEPGQTLEFYMEASDFNPDMTGISASEISRVKIISDDEYSAMIRSRVTVEDFLARYRAVNSKIKELKAALESLKQLAESGSDDTLAAAREQTAEAYKNAVDLFEKLSSDFQAYDIEEKLASTLGATVGELKRDAAELARVPDENIGRFAASALEKLTKPANLIQQEMENAEELALIWRLMECTARFQRIVIEQEKITRRLHRISGRSGTDETRLLTILGREQESVRKEFAKLINDIKTRADALPANNWRDLAASAIEFAETAEKLNIGAFMIQARQAAEDRNTAQAHRYATIALEKLMELLSECESSCFGGMCQNRGIRFQTPPDLKVTLEQILAALAAQAGGGAGQGGIGAAGAGFAGGVTGDGYWMQGQSLINIPVFGPERVSFTGASHMPSGGAGRDAAAPGKVGIDASSRAAIDTGDAQGVDFKTLQMEQAPEKYRNALKRYFDID